MLVLGLTGSVGMGKSTVAGMFAEKGVAIFNADHAVHALYRGKAAPLIEKAFPGTVSDGVADRERLAGKAIGNPNALARLEAIVHPLVHEEEAAFRVNAASAGRRVILLDIPLLLEKKSEGRVDAVIVVSAPAEIQRQRVLARPGMSEERFAAILARQMPDSVKRRHAHFIIDTSGPFDDTRVQVCDMLRAVAGMACGK